MIEERKIERMLLNEFCRKLWNSRGIDNTHPCEWEQIEPELSKFFESKGISGVDLSKFKNRLPLAMLIKGKNHDEISKLWDDYWRWEHASKEQIEYLRDKFCGGLGSRKVKIRLNMLSKISIDASFLRVLLELEDSFNCESRYFGTYLNRMIGKRQEAALHGRILCEQHPHMFECGTFGNGTVFFTIKGNEEQFRWKFDQQWAESNFDKINLFEHSIKIYDEDQITRLERLILPKVMS